MEYAQRVLPPEHPRASSTDDVEGFFALLHELLGPVFDLKQFFDELPKILNEFQKRIDPDLPFFIGLVLMNDSGSLLYPRLMFPVTQMGLKGWTGLSYREGVILEYL